MWLQEKTIEMIRHYTKYDDVIRYATSDHAAAVLSGILKAGCPSCRPTNSVKALEAT